MTQLSYDDSALRTELPTPLRLQEARRQGLVARSADLAAAAVVMAAVAALAACGPKLLSALTGMTAAMLEGPSQASEGPAEAVALLWQTLPGVLAAAAPVVLAAVLAAVLINVAQVGLLAADGVVRVDLQRVSPAAGLHRMASWRSVVRTVMAIAKIAAVTAVCAPVVRDCLPQVMAAAGVEGGQMAYLAGDLASRVAIRAGLVLLALGMVDYLYQRWQHREDLKITRRQLQEDLRRMEGGGLARSRRRRLARQSGAAADAEAVKRADVVTFAAYGPAVALKYDPAVGPPIVTARGAAQRGRKIRQAAAEAGVAVVENALARALYRQCRVGDEIPVAMYEPVADILARAQMDRRQGSPDRQRATSDGRLAAGAEA